MTNQSKELNSSTKMKAKLVFAVVCFVIALALISTATFAWYTISRSADSSGMGITVQANGKEIPLVLSTSYDGEYTTSIKMSVAFADKLSNTVLRPISTSDGLNWYLPSYDESGNVDGFNAAYDTDTVANRLSTGAINESNLNYLVYTDIWIKLRDSSNANGYTLHLNNPSTSTGSRDEVLARVQDDEKFFGSMAMNVPRLAETGFAESSHNGNDVVSAIRVGFRFFDMTPGGTYTSSPASNSGIFWIYEPAADTRSEFFQSEVSASSIQGTEHTELGYIYSEGDQIIANSYPDFADDQVIETYLPQKTADGYGMVAQSSLNTIRQRASSWDSESLASETDSYNCRDIGTLGAFVTPSAVQNLTAPAIEVENLAVSDTPAMVTLKGDKPQKVRIYLWIEGQDIDCWNQMPAGNIFVNLEFRAEPIS